MYKTKTTQENTFFLKRFSADDGSSVGVTENFENSNIAVGAENEQKGESNFIDVRNTSSSFDTPQMKNENMNRPEIIGSSPLDPKVIWSFLDIDDRFQFDLDGVKNTAREIYACQLLDSWYKQSCELSEKYPDFDIHREVKNKTFLSMLKCGISLDIAYKALNYDAILKAELVKALDNFYADVKIRGARPAENGLISGGGITIGLGARSFSRKERADIARRVEKGEKIVL